MTLMQSPTIDRLRTEPVIEPGCVPGYGPIFNAGLVYHDKRFHLLARGVRAGYRKNHAKGPRFVDYRSDVLLFSSQDGYEYVFEKVLAQAAADGVWSYEDPRVQWVRSGDEASLYMTYTDLPSPDSGAPWRIGIHRVVFSHNGLRLNKTSGRIIGPPGVPDKDAVIFNLSDGRPALIHRVAPDIQLAVFDTVEDLLNPPAHYWDTYMAELDDHVIIRPSQDGLGIGAGAPPLVTEAGLLFFYHERLSDSSYTTRVCLLDPATGEQVAALPDPVLIPELSWEREGDVDNVVFIQGAHRMDDGRIYLTYGAADRAVGAGTIDEKSLLDSLTAL